ncbi:MAG: hypothetical protein ACOYLT_01950 [Flavobacterium sp.]|jgi:hypothetical protein|uniref:hypothetical protein n=1 Tax=Flavobacterium sp. TaxID=239 RepID=UPI003BDA5EE1
MKKILIIGFFVLLLSCQDKEVLLPISSESIIAEVKDYSTINLFFKIENKDTLVDFNTKNSINANNWLFNIDKRLPLRKVILEVKKLQNNKSSSMYKNKTYENYFTYTDTVKKTMAFMPFSKIHFRLEKPDFNLVCFHLDRNDLVHYNEMVFSKSQILEFINKLPKNSRIYFSFDKGMSFGKYIEYEFFIKHLVIPVGISINYKKEYIY